MSTRSTLWRSEEKKVSLFEETLYLPILKEGPRIIYPVFFEVTTLEMDLTIRLPDDLSIKLVKAKRGWS